MENREVDGGKARVLTALPRLDPMGFSQCSGSKKDPDRSTIYPSLEEFRKLDDKEKLSEFDIEIQEVSIRKIEPEED